MIFEAPKEPTPWAKAERVAGWVLSMAGAVGGVAVAIKAIMDVVEASKKESNSNVDKD